MKITETKLVENYGLCPVFHQLEYFLTLVFLERHVYHLLKQSARGFRMVYKLLESRDGQAAYVVLRERAKLTFQKCVRTTSLRA